MIGDCLRKDTNFFGKPKMRNGRWRITNYKLRMEDTEAHPKSFEPDFSDALRKRLKN